MDFKVSLFQYLQSLPSTNINLANSGMGGINPEGLDNSVLEDLIANMYQVKSSQVILLPSGTFGSFFILYYLRRKLHKFYSITPEYPVFFYQASELGYDIITENRITDNTVDLSPWDVDENSVYFVSNPNNPTGTIWSDESVRSILRETEGNNSYLVLDDTFSFFNQKYQRPKVDIGNLIVVGSISKFFGYSGARLGWIVSRDEIIHEMKDLIRYVVPEISEINKKRAAYLFKNMNIYNSFNFKKLEENYKILKERLDDYLIQNSIQIINSLKLEKSSSMNFSQNLTMKGVNTVPGFFFGDDSIVRLGIGLESSDRIDVATKIILEETQ